MLSFAGRSFDNLADYLGEIERELGGLMKKLESGTLKRGDIAVVSEGLKSAKEKARSVEDRLRLKEAEESFRESLRSSKRGYFSGY